VVVLSSSPESFLRVDRGRWGRDQANQGTRARGAGHGQDATQVEQLRDSAKTEPSILMVVDLLRNDLGKVCRVARCQCRA